MMDLMTFISRYQEEQSVHFKPIIRLSEYKKNNDHIRRLEVINEDILILEFVKVGDGEPTLHMNDYLLQKDYDNTELVNETVFNSVLEKVKNVYIDEPRRIINF